MHIQVHYMHVEGLSLKDIWGFRFWGFPLNFVAF